MSFDSPSLATVAVALGVGIWAIRGLSRIGSREPNLPPGPPTVPLLGNVLAFPTEKGHFQFAKWAKEYGEIFSLKLGPGTVIVVTSSAAFRELMDHQSTVTAGRPQLHIPKMADKGLHFAGLQYGDEWRKLRRIHREILTPQAAIAQIPIQQAEAAQLMHDFLIHPTDFADAIRRFTFSVITTIVYGKRAPRYETPETAEFYHVQHLWGRLLDISSFPPVDLIPILKLVPERFAEWKRQCKEVWRLQSSLYFGFLDNVKERLARGEGNGSWMESVATRADKLEISREQTAYIGGGFVDVGTDTTVTYLLSLVLALVASPEVQRKAQEEIDRVIGTERTPTLDDFEKLPYVQAVVQEVIRFRPIAPLLFPRATTADAWCKGYLIPSGSTIITNFWGISHDDRVFADEDKFDPDRFLKNKFGVREELAEELKDWKEDIAFGSGRRSCPGIHLAKHVMNISTLNLLWGFNFGKARDPTTGAEIEPDLWDYAKGGVLQPNPFKCTITPRSVQHAELIRNQYLDASTVFEQYERELSPQDRQYVNDQRKIF